MTASAAIEHISQLLSGEVIPATPKPEQFPPPPRDYEESEERLRAAGIDAVLALIEEGQSQREICLMLGARVAHLNRWLTSTPDGSTRVHDARKRAAQAWMDRGLAVLNDAKDPMALAKAREIATMCRKYAAIADPTYSDRVQVDTTVKAEDASSIDQRLRLLVGQVAQVASKPHDE